MFKSITDSFSALLSTGEKDKSEENGSQIQKRESTEGTASVGGDGVSDQDERTSPSGPPQLSGTESQSSLKEINKEDVSESKEPESGNVPSTSKISNSADGQDHVQEEITLVEADGQDETKIDMVDEKLDEFAQKAKQWGSYLFSATKAAGASVSAKAKELKRVVEEKTILGDFAREQNKFVQEKTEKSRSSEAAVPPWVGYNEEEQMKVQMLSLSNDKRNFLRNPPTGVQFHFDYETCYPVAMAALAEDEKLQKMRFELVPKQVAEPDFWRNYFYRVSLIKQSTQLSSLAKQSDYTSENSTPKQEAGTSKTASKQDKVPVDESLVAPGEDVTAEDAVQASDEFVSDAYNLEISDEDLRKEMEALRADSSADIDWEKELQKELTDYEVVGGTDIDVDDDALEKEILNEIETG